MTVKQLLAIFTHCPVDTPTYFAHGEANELTIAAVEYVTDDVDTDRVTEIHFTLR